jgi:hypothetical protein
MTQELLGALNVFFFSRENHNGHALIEEYIVIENEESGLENDK